MSVVMKVFNAIDAKDGIKVKVTFMALLKEDKLWRAMIHRVER